MSRINNRYKEKYKIPHSYLEKKINTHKFVNDIIV